MTALLSLLACARYGASAMTLVEGGADPVDECDLGCVTVALTQAGQPVPGVEVTVATGGAAISDADGLATICPPAGSLAPGTTALAITAQGATLEVPLDVRPFGWFAGLDKGVGAPDPLGPIPTFSHPAEPILVPAPGTWYARQVAHPYLSDEGLLAFGGAEDYAAEGETNPYQVGIARFDGATVTGVPDVPLFADDPDAWGSAARNSPELHRGADGRLVLWFQGRDPEDTYAQVGRAFSEDDGATWTPDPENPVFTWGLGVDHPTVRDHRDGRVELWFHSFGGAGYAISDDAGATFTPFCGNPAYPDAEGDGLKAPQVVWLDDRYVMVPTRGGAPTWGIDWAESYDGVRWTEGEAFVLAPGGAAWHDEGVSGAQLLVEDDGFALLYAGTGSDGANGIAIAR